MSCLSAKLLEGIQRGGGYQVKRRRRLRIELLEGFELLELIEGALQRAFTARRRLSGMPAIELLELLDLSCLRAFSLRD